MQLTINVGSVAMAVEALETLLVEKGVLKDGELIERLKSVAQKHYAKDEFIPAAND